MLTRFSARTGFFPYKHMVFPIMRIFPNITGREMSALWRRAWQSSVGQTIASGCPVNNTPPCTMKIQWDDRAPAALLAIDTGLQNNEIEDIMRLIDSMFCASHCVLMLPIECYLRMQHVLHIEADFIPHPSKN